MGVLLILIVASLMVASGFLIAFVWSVNKGQFDEGVSPSIRILMDDSENKSHSSTSQNP